MSQKSSIVRFSVFVVGFLGLGGGGGGAKIMSQKSSIVTSLVSFVSVLVVVLLHVAAVFVDVLTSGVGVLTSSSRSGCPCLSNGPNCRQEYTCTCALIYTHTHTKDIGFPSTYLQSVHVHRRSFPSTPPVTLAACAVAHSQTPPYPLHDAASYDHLGPESTAQTQRSYSVCV